MQIHHCGWIKIKPSVLDIATQVDRGTTVAGSVEHQFELQFVASGCGQETAVDSGGIDRNRETRKCSAQQFHRVDDIACR